jgi:tRNA nucleotidyltransferase (CCA-adding enzyme)
MERTTPGRNLASWIRDRFPKDVYAMLEVAGKTAESMGYAAYLVGGSVRDLLLREENLDIDIVVEGNGILFARSLGKKLQGSIRTHEKFGTATISLGQRRIDVATARMEYYEAPAALPTVETSSIKKDLYRRDFTINTLAIRLNRKGFGQLIDFFGGQRDLREKTIRVLHNLSFVEDPTRAFRAIRFSERFGFKLSRHTENLIKSAIQMDLFEKLSGFRLYEELILAFRETNPVRTLKRFSEFNLLKVIHPDLAFTEHLEQLFTSVSETRAWYNLLYLDEDADITLLYLLTLLSDLNREHREDALKRLAPPPRIKELILRSTIISEEILRRLPAKDPAEIYHLLITVPLETLLFAMSSTSDPQKKKDISSFLVTLKKVRPALKGRDLKKLGIPEGPVYSKILGQLLDERLKGRLKTEQDEREFVINILQTKK